MPRFLTTSAQSMAFCFVLLASPAQADLVIEGRDAQKLHCAAMLVVLADRLESVGLIPPEALKQAQFTAVALLAQLPGSERDRVRALVQRSEKIMATRTMPQLIDEFRSTVDWCAAQLEPEE